MPKYFCFITVVILLFHSCNYDPGYINEQEGSAWENASAPLSDQELAFIDSVQQLGFSVKIDHPFIDRMTSPVYRVDLYNDSLYVNKENYQFLTSLREQLVDQLFTSVISDSVLHDCEYIEFNYHTQQYFREGNFMKPYNSELTSDQFSPIKDFQLDSLAQRNGFSVIKTKANHYKRVVSPE